MKKVKKILAICLSCIMFASLCGITARADEIREQPEDFVDIDDTEVVEIPDHVDGADEVGQQENIPIDDSVFPDAYFREYISAHFDTSKDGQLSAEEIGNAKEIEFPFTPFPELTDLTGIKVFTSLTALRCSGQLLTSLDVGGLTSLTELWCDDNSLTSLDVTGCSALTVLYCNSNQLTSLNLSGCTSLNELWCDKNSLASLDVSGCTALTELLCNKNHLTSLNVSGCTNLTNLQCTENQLTNLDVTGCSVLSVFWCSDNKLTSLDVSGNPALVDFLCNINKLTSLDVSMCPNLSVFWCDDNALKTLDVSKCPNLTQLCCHINKLTNLDIRKNKILVETYRTGTRTKVDNTYSYWKDSNCLSVDTSVKIVDTNPSVIDVFNDVKKGDWFVNAVQYVYDNEIMGGKGASFEPNTKISREEFVRVLYNHAGTPDVTIENPYADVKAGAWYEKAVLWAKEKDIANGKVKDGKAVFGVGASITREEMALMFYKYAKLNGYTLAKDDHAIDGFSDAEIVSSWAKDAMNWAVTNGVMGGKGSRLDPKGNATRAECASMFKNMIENTAQ